MLYTQLYDAAVEANARGVISNILLAQVQTSIIGNLFDGFAVIFTLVTLLGLAVAASLVHAEKDSAVDRILLFGGYGLAALLSILNIVVFALSERRYTIVYGDSTDGSSTSTAWSLLRSTRNVSFAMLVIQLAFNVAVLIKSVLVAVKTKSEPRVTTVSSPNRVYGDSRLTGRPGHEIPHRLQHAPAAEGHVQRRLLRQIRPPGRRPDGPGPSPSLGARSLLCNPRRRLELLAHVHHLRHPVRPGGQEAARAVGN